MRPTARVERADTLEDSEAMTEQPADRVPCPSCDGSGYLKFPTVNPEVTGTYACPACRGSGEKPKPKKP